MSVHDIHIPHRRLPLRVSCNSPEPGSADAGRRYGDRALMLGTLSILLFWTFGAGLLLGYAALIAGGMSTNSRGNETESASPIPVEPFLGMAAGFIGIVIGAAFLAVIHDQM
ncbi:hypothetical protein ACT89R_29920 (plasmid) [Rhodococcus qingshengii]